MTVCFLIKTRFPKADSEIVGVTMMCDRGAMEMWKTAVRFTHISTAQLLCLRRKVLSG